MATLELIANEHILKINFPPHAAKSISIAVEAGDEITIKYEEKKPEHDPKGYKKPKLKLLSLSITSGSELFISAIKPQKPTGDPVPEVIRLEQFELLKGKKEELVGIRSGKQLFHIHKDDQEFADKINPGSLLEITAVKRTDNGFINENDEDVYHIHKMVIDGQEYTPKNNNYVFNTTDLRPYRRFAYHQS